jgi:hypothetical protein
MSKYKLRLKRYRRKKRAVRRAAALQPIIDGQTLIKMFEKRLDALFGQVRNPIRAGLQARSKTKF